MTRAIIILSTPIFALALALASANAQTAQTRARADSAKAADLLARLEELLCPAGAGLDSYETGARRRKLLASLNKKLSPLPESDLKADLAASLNFYEQSLEAIDARPTRCETERPGAYLSLCARAGGDRRALLLEKSRLRASWARAALSRERGGGSDAPAAEALLQADAEHEFERGAAAEAVARLRGLEARVVVYGSRAEFEESGALARVSYERFRTELETASARLRRIITWLPPGAPREEIRKATQAYLDGAWWWSKTRSTLAVRVSGNSFNEDRDARPVNESTARYTVALHWRQARDYTRRAAALLPAD